MFIYDSTKFDTVLSSVFFPNITDIFRKNFENSIKAMYNYCNNSITSQYCLRSIAVAEVTGFHDIKYGNHYSI